MPRFQILESDDNGKHSDALSLVNKINKKLNKCKTDEERIAVLNKYSVIHNLNPSTTHNHHTPEPS